MTTPLVSIVVETITARYDSDSASGSLADSLRGTLAAIEGQTYPRQSIEVIVVVDDAVDPNAVEELRRRHADVQLVHASESNYFAAKNAGAAAACGSVIAMLDGDCEPAPDWLELMVSRFEPGVDVVVGCTRYSGRSLLARTFSVPDFAGVLDDGDGASGFNISNAAFRTEALLAHPLEARIRRNGGCYLLYHQLRAAGARIVYESRARVSHGLDIRGFGVVRKHFERGYDSVSVYRLDDRAVLRGTPYFRRFGGLSLLPITARRIAIDWMRLAKHRRQIGISLPTLPYYASVALATRLIELIGAFLAVVDPHRYSRPTTGR